MKRLLLVSVILLTRQVSSAATLVVPDDHATIQAALNAAGPGDTVSVKDTPGPYFEKISFPTSGAPGVFITLQAHPGHNPILDGTGVPGSNMVVISSKSYVRLSGFEIRNNLTGHRASAGCVWRWAPTK